MTTTIRPTLKLSSLSTFDVAGLLANEREPSELRHRAALHLTRANTPDAIKALIKNTKVRDRHTLIGVVKALGRIGDQSALPALERVQRGSSGHISKLAHFSAALISHRLGLAGNDLPVPDEREHLSPPTGKLASISSAVADRKQIQLCVRSIASQTFGITIDEALGYKLICDKRELMVLFNRTFRRTDAGLDVAKRKAFPGLVAEYKEVSQTYSVRYLLLTSPAGKAVNIIVARTNGDIVFSGKAKPAGKAYDFSLSAVARPGAYALQLKGSWKNDGLSLLEAKSSLTAQVPKNTPAELV